MKNFLAAVATIALVVIAGSVAYYYVIFLPQQQTRSANDLNAIRSVVAPTPAEQAAQQQATIKAEQDSQAALNAYFACQQSMQPKIDAYLQKQCPDTGDPLYMIHYSDCAAKAMQTAGYQQLQCKNPFNP